MNEETPEVEEEAVVLPAYKQVALECAEALKASRRIVEGTEFLGFNRAELRARGLRSERPRVVQKFPKAAPHWFGEYRKVMAQPVPGFKVESEVKEHVPVQPMSNDRRWEVYGEEPSPAQARRLKKKFHRSLTKAS